MGICASGPAPPGSARSKSKKGATTVSVVESVGVFLFFSASRHRPHARRPQGQASARASPTPADVGSRHASTPIATLTEKAAA